MTTRILTINRHGGVYENGTYRTLVRGDVYTYLREEFKLGPGDSITLEVSTARLPGALAATYADEDFLFEYWRTTRGYVSLCRARLDELFPVTMTRHPWWAFWKKPAPTGQARILWFRRVS